MRFRILSTLLLLAAGAGPARAGVNVSGTYTGVLVNGSTSFKYDIVFVGDGFTATQQADFDARVDDAVAAIAARPGFEDRMCALNVWRVNVVSVQSGVDHPADGIFRNTELNVRYGNPADGEAERCIRSDTPELCTQAADFAPDYDAVFVLANDTQWGGCAGSLVFSSISPGFDGIITHELGHKIGSLGDEYECYICDGSDDDRTYTGVEPSAANLTTNLAMIKWGDLILPGTPIPTTLDVPPGVVGAWEGGGTFAFDIFRPQKNCHMRATGSEFCAVCARRIETVLSARCTACEIDPLGFECLFGDLRRFLAIDPRYRIARWPWPGCLTCPADGIRLMDRARLVLRGLPDKSTLQVFDEEGLLLAVGQKVRNSMVVEFDASRARSYFFDVFLFGDGSVRASAQLFRNGKKLALPQ